MLDQCSRYTHSTLYSDHRTHFRRWPFAQDHDLRLSTQQRVWTPVTGERSSIQTMTSPACRGPQCVLYQVSGIRYQGFVHYLLIFHPIRRVSVWAPHQNLVSNDGVQNAHTYSVLLSAISAIHRCCMRMLRVVVRSRSALFAMTLMRAGVGVDEVDANFRSGICLPRVFAVSAFRGHTARSR